MVQQHYIVNQRLQLCLQVDYETSQCCGIAGPAIEACWDGGLAAAIRSRGNAIEEEQVLGSLLEDFRAL